MFSTLCLVGGSINYMHNRVNFPNVNGILHVAPKYDIFLSHEPCDNKLCVLELHCFGADVIISLLIH
jgi:hypothetical protein